MVKSKIILNIVLIGMLSFSLYEVADKYISYKKADDVYSELQEIKNNFMEKDSRNEEENIGNELDLSYINEDYCGWITIENTNIDYPILQGIDNNYYLSRDINNEYLSSGSIVLDCRNNGFNDKNTILYGHNMKNNTMFSQLEYFKKSNFFKENRYINVMLSQGNTLKYEIFSVYTTDTSDNYLRTSFENEKEYRQFLDSICDKSLFTTDIEVAVEDIIITLSTCSYEYEGARTVVHGKLIRKQ